MKCKVHLLRARERSLTLVIQDRCKSHASKEGHLSNAHNRARNWMAMATVSSTPDASQLQPHPEQRTSRDKDAHMMAHLHMLTVEVLHARSHLGRWCLHHGAQPNLSLNQCSNMCKSARRTAHQE
eukprot:6492150-Amphidinium_carterae.2